VRARLVTAVFLSAPLAACVGSITAPGSGSWGGGGGGPGPAGAPYVFQCADASGRGLSEADGRRLSRDELVNTLEDLLGPTVFQGLSTELQLLPGDPIKDAMTEFKPMHSEEHVQAMLAIAEKAASLIVDDSTELSRVAPGCGTTPTPACVQDFIRDFGLKVFRRPLTLDEQAELLDFYAQGDSPEDGLKLLLMRLLQSPQLLFLFEEGGSQTDSGRVRLTDFEVAARIAYRTTASAPDALLLAAATNGELQSLDAVRAHAERLVNSERGKARVARFFDYWGRLDDFPAFTYSPAFLGSLDGAGLRDEVIQETRDFFHHVVWDEQGGVKDLFTSRSAFIKSDRLAALYGAGKMTDPATPVTLGPQRAGYLLRPGFLAGGTDISSPIGRSVRIFRRVTCDPLPPPPTAAVTSRLTMLGPLDRSVLSNRQVVETQTSPDFCQSCHGRINPQGFVFEAYDSLGRARQVETVYSPDGGVLATHPIDTHVENVTVEDTPVSLDTADQLEGLIAGGKKAPACFATQVYRYTRLRNETPDDGCALSDLEQTLRAEGGNLVGAFIRNVANDDIFWKRQP
jgi:hypothetical protein